MAELLMKFGADPDATDGSGRTGRSLMKKNAKLQELVDRWDAHGAAAFEVSGWYSNAATLIWVLRLGFGFASGNAATVAL